MDWNIQKSSFDALPDGKTSVSNHYCPNLAVEEIEVLDSLRKTPKQPPSIGESK